MARLPNAGAFSTNPRSATCRKVFLLQEPFRSIMLDYCQGKQTDQFIFPFLKDKFRSYSEPELAELIQPEVGDCDRLLKKAAAILGMDENITLLTTRNSFGEHLMELIGEIKTLQDSLDHTDISTTQRHVSRMNQTRVDRGNSVYDRW